MAEVSNELIYGVLEAIQGRPANIEDRLSAVEMRIDALAEQTRALTISHNATNTDVANLYRMFGTIDHRLARIERRLDIIEEPVK
ncbi:MAG: hypothetical protein IPK28_03425 [Devosia sp.]|nr:hypothetical protein [Devosia sp.]